MATNVSANTAPAVAKVNWTPVNWKIGRPRMPLRPNTNRRATPPTTGGRTMGRMVRARMTRLPRNVQRARSQANGIPNTRESPVAHSEHTSDRCRASSATVEVRSDHNVDHEVLSNKPTSGNARKRTVTAPSATTTNGGRRRPPFGASPILT